MKRTVSLLVVLLVAFLLASCIISKSPNKMSVIVPPGKQTKFSVVVFPTVESFAWALDNAPLVNTGNSFLYTPTGGEHSLTVTATTALGTDKWTWKVIDADIAQVVDVTGSTVEVTNPASPAAGTKVIIPSGALESSVTIFIGVENPPAGLPGLAAGPGVRFGPEGTQFISPVDIILPYVDADNDGIVDGTGLSEDQVKAWFYNDIWRTWEEVPEIDRDLVNNFVRIQSTHFSLYTTNVSVITFNKALGNKDELLSAQQTSDGGYILAGNTYSYESDDWNAWLMKTDENGNKVWDKTFGENIFKFTSSVQQTSDDGYLLAGGTNYMGAGNGDAWLIKTDTIGNIVWYKTFGGSGDDGFTAVQQTNDGGYIMTGYYTAPVPHNSRQAWLVKTDMNGNAAWEKTFNFGEDADQQPSAVMQTSDGGYILAVTATVDGDYDACLIKTDAYGNKVWDKTFGGFNYQSDGVYDLQLTSDGGYILAADTTSFWGTDSNAWIIKTDLYGNKIWDRTFGGIQGYDRACAVQQTKDGGYIIVGITDTDNWEHAWLIKTDENGNKDWEKTFGENLNNCSYAVQQTRDGGYMLAGMTDSSIGATTWDAWLVKTDANGNAPATPTP